MIASALTSARLWLSRSWMVMRQGWWRFALVIVAMTAASVVVVVLASGLLPTLVYAQRGLIVDVSNNTVLASGVLLILFELAVPLTVLVLALLSWSLATVAILGADILSARPQRLVAAAIRGAKRTPSLLGALVLVVLGLAVSFVFAPVLVVAGVLGLLLTPLVRLAASRWPAFARWPRVQVFVILAVPFATTLALAVWWGLVIPSVAIEQLRPVQALRRSRELVSARFWPAVLCLLVGLVIYGGSQLAVTGLVGFGMGDDIALALRVVSQTLLVAVPVVIATVLHRELSGSGERLDSLGPVDLARAVGKRVTSGMLTIALIVGLLIPLTGAPSSARAEGIAVEPGVEQIAELLGEDLSGSATGNGDEGSSGDAAATGAEPEPEAEPESGTEPEPSPSPEAGPEAEPGPEGEVEGGTDTAVGMGTEIGAGTAGTDPEAGADAKELDAAAIVEDAPPALMAMATPPSGGFLVASLGDQDDANPGDGLCAESTGECTLRAAVTEANQWPGLQHEISFALSGTITLSSPLVVEVAMSIDGGGNRIVVDGGSAVQLLRFTATVAEYTLRYLTLSNGRAGANGGGAIESSASVGSIDSVTFVGNSSGTVGGAVAVHAGQLELDNTTFWQNSASQGADIANVGGQVSVDFSTFVPASGSSLHNAVEGWKFLVYFSLIAGECSGDIDGGASHAPPSCPRMDDRPATGLGSFGDHGGVVHTVALDYLSPAVDAYYGGSGEGGEGGGSSLDARGVERPQGESMRVDLGAFELEGGGPPPPPDEGPWYPSITLDGDVDNPSEFGESVTFVATVWPNRPANAPADASEPTGSVLFRVGELELATVPLAAGVASITIDDLPVGVNEVTAEYSGDGNYVAPPRSYRVLHTVAEIATTVSLVGSPSVSVTGQGVDFTASVTPAVPGGPALDGRIYFVAQPVGGFPVDIGNVEIDASGQATIRSSDFGTGPLEVTAYYVPASSDFLRSEVTIGHTVNAATTDTALSASIADPVFGQSVGFTAIVTTRSPGAGVPSGQIEFSHGSVTVTRPLVDGEASYSTGGLGVGTTTVTARFIPTIAVPPAYATSSQTVDVAVQKADIDLVVTSTPLTTALGQQATLRADVTARAPGGGAASGTVEFWRGSEFLDSATLASGVAIIATDALPVGTHQLTVVYRGDTNFRLSTVDHEHRVAPVTTAVSVTTSAITGVTGQPVQYTARVTTTGAGTAIPSGTVVFSGLVSGTAALAIDGTAVLDTVIPPSSQTSATVGATFHPDDTSTASSGGFVAQQLLPAGVTVSVTGPSAAVALGTPLRLSVDVVGKAPSTTRPTSGTLVVSKGAQVIATVQAPFTWPTIIDLATWGGVGVGSHDLSVVYRNGIGYGDGVDAVTAIVAPAVTELHLLVTPDGAAEYDNPVTITAAITAPFNLEPSGVISIYDGSTLLHSGFVASIGSRKGVMFDTAGLAVGDHQLRAEFNSWDARLSHATTAQNLIYTVHPIGTTTHLVLGPVLVGDPLSWSVLVRSTRDGYHPTGSIRLTVDGQTLPLVPLAEDPNSATFSFATVTAPSSPSLPVGSYALVAEYVPSGAYAASTAVGEQSVVSYLSTVTLSARTTPGIGPWQSSITGVAWGEAVEVRAQISASAGTPGAPQPTGTVVFDGGVDGVSCSVSSPLQSCVLAWPESGTFSVTAQYEGDLHYGQETSAPHNATIDRKTPVFVQVGIQESPVVTGEPTTAYWNLAGPSAGEGEVQVDFGAVPGCTVAGPAGSCAATYELGRAGQPQNVIVRYLQNSRWNAATHSIPVTPLGCYPLNSVAHEGGTLTVLTAPNCNSGTGYLDGTEVWLRPSTLSHPSNGHNWQFDGFSPALTGPGPDYSLRVGIGAGKTTSINARFHLDIRCATVRLTPQFSTSTAQLQPLGAPDCPIPDATHREIGQWQHGAAGSYTGRFLIGSEVRSEVLLGGSEDVLYGYRWDSAIASVETRRSASSFIAERDTQVWVVAGPRCYAVDVTRTGPGMVRTTANSPGCHNPSEPAGTWTAGTVLELTATPDSRTPAYVDGWDGFEPESISSFVSNRDHTKLQSGEVARYTVVAGQPSAALSVHFGTCRSLSIEPVIQGTARGTVDVEPSRNCEVAPNEPGLFMEGAEVQLRAAPATGFDIANTYRTAFGKWNLGDDHDADAERTLVMDRDIALRPSFYQVYAQGCVPVRLVSGDAARVRVNMTQTSFEDDQICAHGTLASGFGASFEGSFNPKLEPVLQLQSELVSVGPQIGWELEVPGKGRLGQLGANLDISGLRTGITATAYACQAIEPLVALSMESGEVITERAEAGSELIMTNPAPDCPYAEDAWLVGTTVELAALGNPAGYGFTGWSGAADGKALTTKVHLDGSSPSVTVTAAYEVSCYTLTLTHDKKDVTAYPTPNCRGTDPALGRYIGGSTVSMYGKVPGGKIWQGWTGDVVERGKVNPAFVIMDEDKSAGHRWRSKSWDEELVGGLEWFGDQVAIAAKKAVGVIALAVKELAGSALATIPPFAVLATIGPALSLIGTILELAGVSEDITKYLHFANETFDWMLSTFSCAASWSFASSGGGGAGTGGSSAEEIARAGLEGYDVASQAKDTVSMVMDARKAYFGVAKMAAKGASKAAAAGGFVFTVGIDIAGTIMDTGIGWEKDATSAWTDGTVFTDCMRGSVPSYMHEVIDEIDKVT